jgi:hypothetical protein
MSKKRLIICGDSFMSPTLNSPGTHFSEIIADELNFELVTLSRSAMSNGGIVSQLEYAITLNPSLILFNTTFADRVEFTMTKDNITDGEFDLTCQDFYYGDRKDYSCETMKDNTPMMGSESIESLLSRDSIFKDKINSYEMFLTNIYNRRWKMQMDRHIIYSITHKLYLNKIPFILMIDIINAIDKMTWLPEEHKGFEWSSLDKIRLENQPPDFVDPGYHTTTDVQKIIAEDTIKRITNIIF